MDRNVIASAVLCGGMFWLLDLTLRIMTASWEYYPIYMPVPHLFSLCWGALCMVLLSFVPHHAGQVLYGLCYALWGVYAVVQYGYHRIFDSFLYLSDFRLAGEGANYLGFVRQIVDWQFVLFVLLTVLFGVIGCSVLPDLSDFPRWNTGAVSIIGLAVLPMLYGAAPDAADWDSWQSSAYEYSRFSSSSFDLALTGLYQYVARDVQLAFRDGTNQQVQAEAVDAFFEQKPPHEKNEMTGLLKGKNVIMVQLESIDDWVVSDETTPTLARLMREGISFSNFYTPQYSSGYTFNTEFACQTGVYPPASGNAAYSLGKNAFSHSLANRLAEQGYTTASFHKSEKTFYNRGEMHRAFGYSAYHSALNYAEDELQAGVDRFLVECDELYEEMTVRQPFCDFLITYSGHLGYDERDELTSYALEQYPQYADPDRAYEVNGLLAKARLTDDLFTALLTRLEQDGLLDHTVLVVYDDHYAYGLTDSDLLQRCSEQAGSSILEKTPAFVWYKGCTPLAVEKTMQTVDLLPTLLNLFGYDVPRELPGYDAFDLNYAGCAVFSDRTWLTDQAYVKNGTVQWNNGLTDEQIGEMNQYAARFVSANLAILDADYYRDTTA